VQILFIFSLLFAILVAAFAVMNSNPVIIKLFWMEIPSSQGVVILGSAAIGAIVVSLLGILSKVKSTLKIRELNNKIKQLEHKLEEYKKGVLNEEEKTSIPVVFEENIDDNSNSMDKVIKDDIEIDEKL